MECNYNHNEICTNEQCPACGIFCPVPDIDGICLHEEREYVTYSLTPKGCLLLAMLHNNIDIDDETFDYIWNEFEQTMTNLGYIKED